MKKRMKRRLAENLRQPKGVFGWLVGHLMNHFNRAIIKLTVDSIPSNKSSVILELGIGSGKAIQLVLQRFPKAKIYGLDISETMLSSAKKRNAKSVRQGRVQLKMNTISKMDLPDNSIDTLYTINTIYFWKDPEEAMIEVYRVLKNGAFFILSFNAKEDMSRENYPEDLFTFYSVDEVIKLGKRNQFNLISNKILKDRYENYACLVFEKIL